MKFKKKKLQSLLIKSSLVLVLVNFSAFCKKKSFNEDIQPCDSTGSYYENGVHYIRRDIINDEGGIDYPNLFEKQKERNSNCYPKVDDSPATSR